MAIQWALRSSPAKASKGEGDLTNLVSPWENFPDDVVGKVYGIDCDLDCVEQGYGDWSIVQQSYAELLAIESDYGQYLPID